MEPASEDSVAIELWIEETVHHHIYRIPRNFSLLGILSGARLRFAASTEGPLLGVERHVGGQPKQFTTKKP